MRVHRVLGFLISAGLAAIAACSSDPKATTASCGDGGSALPVEAGIQPGIDDASTDAATTTRPPLTAPQLTLLKADPNIALLGITTGPTPHVVYFVASDDAGVGNFSLQAVPLAGGAPTVLEPALLNITSAVVRGGAVAWWPASDQGEIADSIKIWTPANGPKTVTTPSSTGLFAASEDGTLVAFSALAQFDETPLAITTSAAPSATAPAFGVATSLNLASNAFECRPQLGFAGTTFIGSFCTEISPDEDKPKLFTADASGKVVTRISALPTASSDRIEWSADKTGKKILVFAPASDESLLLLADGDATTIKSLGPVETATISADGSTIVGIEGAKLVAITADSAAKKTTIADAASLLGLSPDSKTVAYASAADGNGTDIQLVDVSASPPKITTVVTPTTASFVGFSGDGTRALYRTGLLMDSPTPHGPLKSFPSAGGTETTLVADSFLARPAPLGAGVLTSSAYLEGSNATSETFGYVDATKGGPSAASRSILRIQDGLWSQKTFVYVDLGVTPGLYALEVP